MRDSFSPSFYLAFTYYLSALPGKFHVILEIGVAKELSVSLAISMYFKSPPLTSVI